MENQEARDEKQQLQTCIRDHERSLQELRDELRRSEEKISKMKQSYEHDVRNERDARDNLKIQMDQQLNQARCETRRKSISNMNMLIPFNFYSIA
jgi:uncharacterized protein (DUF342 family)